MQESGEGVIASVAAPGTITLASPLPAGIVKFDLMNNINGYSSYVEVTDCVFKDNRARGALLKQSNVYCARNVFDHCTGPAILTNIDGCYWFEGMRHTV